MALLCPQGLTGVVAFIDSVVVCVSESWVGWGGRGLALGGF